MGTVDDVVVPLTVSYQETTAGNSSTLTFAALPEDVYRLTVRDAITDAAGNKIDGDGDGVAGGNWTADFVGISNNSNLFSNATTFDTGGANPLGIATGDFNGDGKLDLAVANRSDSTVGILLNNGSSGFSLFDTFSSGGSHPYYLATADFNGDGNLDLAVTNASSNTVGILLGNGAGAFATARTFNTGGSYPTDIAVADFNGDKKDDVVVINGASTGQYGVGILLGDGIGGLYAVSTVTSGGPIPGDVAVGDFNEDGKLDLAVTDDYSQTVEILLGRGNGKFSINGTLNVGTGNGDMAVGDFNNDGRSDLVIVGWSSSIKILFGDGNGWFSGPATFTSGGIRTSDVAVGDFNGDSNLDLAVVNRGVTTTPTNTVGILLGNGGGNFSVVATYGSGSTAPDNTDSDDIAVGDFNGDGRLDVAVTNYVSNSLGILLNGCGPAPVMLNSPHSLPFDIAVGSFGAGEFVQGSSNAFDGDGRLIVGGIPYRPSTLGCTMTDDGQSVVTAVATLAGLTVSRTITVPHTGSEDFARTVDSFINSTGSTITTTVTIVGNLGSDDDTVVFATSDGDTIVEATDQWIGTDDADGSGTPAIIHYIHGPAGLQPTSVSMVGDNITWTYEITVAAGETVQLASFTIVGTTQAEAVAAANALVAPHGELREQAGAFLTAAELQSLANFGVTNYAPVLTAAVVPSLGITNKDTPITVALSAFINNGAGTTTVTDVDSGDLVGGISLTGTTGNGTWAYSLDGTTFISVDAVSSAAALLLPSTAKLRYTPNGKHDEAATITFRAWDMTSGISGSKVDTSTNGGISAFSEAADTASLTLDYTPPRVDGITPTFDDPVSFLSTGILPENTSILYVYFDSNLVRTTVFHNFELCGVGADGLLGTTDDTIVVFTSMTYSYNMSNSKSMMALLFSPLEEGVYRLIVHDTNIDMAGNQLDGNNDGIAGGDWFFDFVIVSHDSNIFATMTTFSSGGVNPCGIEKGDFNGDNKLDIAVTNQYSNDNTVAIFLGDGNGNFSLRSTFNSGGSYPSGIVAADLNNDGLSDLVTANFNSATLGIFLGNGDGTFTASTPINLAGMAGEVICEDFNEDGNIDLAVTNQSKVGILLGNGDGSFADTLFYSSGVSTMPISLTAGDFDGNGTLDLAIGNQGIVSVTILFGDGAGGFSAPTNYSPGGKGLFNIETADFNNDNNLDLVVTNTQSNTVGILLGDGTGHFTTASTYDCGGNAPNDVKVGDFNHDGILDLAMTNFKSKYVSILLGNGDGSFAAALICRSLGNGLNRLVIGDFNGDNAPDLAVANGSSYTVGILLNVINPMLVTLDSPHGMPFDVVAGRFGAGELIQGSNNAFDGYGRLIVGGTPFVSTASYSTTDNGQSIVTASSTTAGLTVSRKVTVPSAGNQDFARTIDSFTNNTDTAITTTVTIVGNLGSDDDTRVFATSDGDTIVEATDQWIGTDDADGSGTPAIIHYIHGPLGLQPTSVSVIGDNITWTYEITVAAGETIQLASFTIVGTTQAEAVAAANALVATHGELREQAGAFLTAAELQSLANFGVTNCAPVLTAAAPSLGTTNEDTPITVALSAFINKGTGTTTITDVDSSDMVGGIALTGTTGNDTWAYSLDGTTFISVDGVSSTSALLLPSTAILCYTPDGEIDETATITYRAWDMTSGTSGAKIDTSTNGGMTAFSSDTDTATLVVDYALPTVVGTTPSLTGGTLIAGTTTLSVNFSETVIGAGMTTNYQLQSVGVDGLLDTADDVIVAITSVSSNDNNATLNFAGLIEGVYRLTVHDAITGVTGNKLDGNVDGADGSDWGCDCVVTPSSRLFDGTPSYATGGSKPTSVATGDFNGDGMSDMVVANSGSNTLGILLACGGGEFSVATTVLSGGLQPQNVVTGDLNGDGKTDLIVANGGSSTVGVLLGNGNGGFGAATTFSTGGLSSYAVAVGDFNDDGKLDLVVANYGSDTVGILLGDGSGGFSAPQTFSTGGTKPASVAVADFNGDGKADLAVVHRNSNTVGVFLGNGIGGFNAAATLLTGSSQLFSVVTGDFNNDGKTDLAIGGGYSEQKVGVFLGNGSGGFGAMSTFYCGGSSQSLAVGDFNTDGLSDLAVANSDGVCSAAILLSNGSGGFSTATMYSGGGAPLNSVAVGDFNGDGKSDLAATLTIGNNVGVLLGKGDGSFVATTTTSLGGYNSPQSMIAGDLNSDGKSDLAVACGSYVMVFLANSSGGLGVGTKYSSGGDAEFVAIGYFNGDGKMDLAVANGNTTGTVGILLGDGNGGFNVARTLSTGGSNSISVVVGDFNRDGKSDLLVANGNNIVSVLLGDGNGGFGTATTFSTGEINLHSIVVGDFNNDGKLDLAVSNQNNGTVGVLLGNGSGGFGAVATIAAGWCPWSMTAGDINGDGNIDLIAANYGNNNIGLLLGNGVGGFTVATALSACGAGPFAAALGDYNGDGKIDLAVSCNTNTLEVFLGNGTGGFATPLLFSTGFVNTFSVTSGDFNGDGKADLAVVNHANCTMALLTNIFNPNPTTLTSPSGMAFEIATGNIGSGQIIQGSNNAFDGYGRLIVDGVAYQSGNSYTTEDDGKTIVTGDDTIDGLTVSRQVTVPNTGNEDFVRTVDSFTNTTGKVITTTVTIVGNLGSNGDTVIFATSDGDTIVEPTDQWIGTDDDDGSGTPAIIHYIHGSRGLRPTNVSVIGDNITWTYTITVAPGETLDLASFTILSANRTNAVAAANTLVTNTGFGGQAAVFLSRAETQLFANFQAPPSVVVTTPSKEQSGNIAINYTLTDAESDTCSIQVQYSLDGGVTWKTAKAGPGGDGTTGLTSSPGGTSHTFVWASASAIVNTNSSNVVVRITPNDGLSGVAGKTGVFMVNNSKISNVVVTATTSDKNTIITWKAADSVGITSVKLTVDGKSFWFHKTSGNKYSASYSRQKTLPAGKHTYTITAVNSKRVQSTYNGTFRVAATTPTISGVKVAASTSDKKTTIAWKAADVDGIASTSLTIDSKAVFSKNAGGKTSAGYSSSSMVAAGKHSYTITVTDSAGKKTSIGGTFTVKATVPTISSLKVKAGTSATATVLTWNAADVDGITMPVLTIDNIVVTVARTSGTAYAGNYAGSRVLLAGKHSYTITVTDAFGMSKTISGTFKVIAAKTVTAAAFSGLRGTAATDWLIDCSSIIAEKNDRESSVDAVFAAY